MFILICGLPNAGKTTYSSQFENAVHIDDLVSKERPRSDAVLEMIQDADDMCIEGVFPFADRRRMYREAYKGEGTKCIWLDTPYEECIKRENRGRPKMIIKNCYALFQPPTLAEGWDEIIRITPTEIKKIYKG